MPLIEWINDTKDQTNWKDRDHAIYDNEDIRIKKLKILGILVYKITKKQDSKCELNEFDKEGSVKGFASSLFEKQKQEKKIKKRSPGEGTF